MDGSRLSFWGFSYKNWYRSSLLQAVFSSTLKTMLLFLAIAALLATPIAGRFATWETPFLAQIEQVTLVHHTHILSTARLVDVSELRTAQTVSTSPICAKVNQLMSSAASLLQLPPEVRVSSVLLFEIDTRVLVSSWWLSNDRQPCWLGCPCSNKPNHYEHACLLRCYSSYNGRHMHNQRFMHIEDERISKLPYG